MSLEIEYKVSELTRRLESLVSFGVIAEVSEDGNYAKVRIDEQVTTDFLPVSGDFRGSKFSNPLEVNNQVTVLNPNGNLNDGLIIGFIRRDTEAPRFRDRPYVDFGDATVSYDPEKKEINLDVKSESSVTINIQNGNGDVNVTSRNLNFNVDSVSINKDGQGDLVSHLVSLFEAVGPVNSNPIVNPETGILNQASQLASITPLVQNFKKKGGGI